MTLDGIDPSVGLQEGKCIIPSSVCVWKGELWILLSKTELHSVF